jgi:hypothetical protein
MEILTNNKGGVKLCFEGFTYTKRITRKHIIIYDNGPRAAARRMLVFASEEGLRHMSSAQQWFMDGTFGVAPNLFDQLYVIRAPLGDTSVSCVYALLPGRSQEIYEELFRGIVNACDLYDFTPDPTVIIADFEKAAWQAASAVFGSNVSIKGCFFHLTQSTWRKVQSLGLTAAYMSDDSAKHFCGMLDALAFLPISDLREGLDYLKQHVPAGFNDLLSYFDSTYISGPSRSIRCAPSASQPSTIRMRIRRQPPLFPPETWNAYDATLANGQRTNNQTEAWNRTFADQVGHRHPSLYAFITNIQKDNALVIVALEADARGQPAKKRYKKASRDLQERLFHLCAARRDGTKTSIQLLKAIGHTIRFQ